MFLLKSFRSSNISCLLHLFPDKVIYIYAFVFSALEKHSFPSRSTMSSARLAFMVINDLIKDCMSGCEAVCMGESE